MKRQSGFTLIELLIVVAIMGVILAIAVPQLRHARQAADGASAVQSLRTITTAEILYERRYGQYGPLSSLAPEGTLDTSLASGIKSAYQFTLSISADKTHFYGNADPIEEPLLLNHYYVDDSNLIRVNLGSTAGASSPPLGN